MKIGSLVECIKENYHTFHMDNPIYKFPKKGQIYTIRGFPVKNGVYLEEIVNSLKSNTNMEIAWRIDQFRELEIPPAIEAEIEESIKEPVLL